MGEKYAGTESPLERVLLKLQSIFQVSKPFFLPKIGNISQESSALCPIV